MAVVKIHQIRSTLDASIAYIVNPEKTQNGTLVSTSGCAPTPEYPSLIAADFQMTQDEADQVRTVGRRPTVQGLHVIQSFKPGEVTAEEAHKIGLEFANQITEGEHQYVLATHTDRGHVHNHLIFNPVNEVTLKRYRTPKGEVFRLREVSDALCREHGLNVIESPTRGNQAPSLGERHARARGMSTKDTLRAHIDNAVSASTSLDELISQLRAHGITVTFRGRDMLVLAPAIMERPIRTWRLGPAYSESNLAARLGRSPVATFTVAQHMVKDLDKHTYKVTIPTLPGFYLAVPKTQAVNHGKTWHLHLPEASSTPVVNRSGGYEVAFTPEELSTWFTPYHDHRLVAPERDRVSTRPRGRTDKQRAYFASVDRRAARLAERFGTVNLKSELSRLSQPERIALRDSVGTRLTLARATLRNLVLERDRVTGSGRQEIEAEITAVSESIRDHETTLNLIDPVPQPTHERKGQRR